MQMIRNQGKQEAAKRLSLEQHVRDHMHKFGSSRDEMCPMSDKSLLDPFKFWLCPSIQIFVCLSVVHFVCLSVCCLFEGVAEVG